MASVCSTGQDMGEYLSNFEFIKAFTCPYAEPVGFAVVAMLVFGAISMAIYIRTDSVLIPFVLILLAGGAILPMVASPVVTIAIIVLLVTGAGVIAWVYHRNSR